MQQLLIYLENKYYLVHISIKEIILCLKHCSINKEQKFL
jgi:hypothetical protein